MIFLSKREDLSGVQAGVFGIQKAGLVDKSTLTFSHYNTAHIRYNTVFIRYIIVFINIYQFFFFRIHTLSYLPYLF